MSLVNALTNPINDSVSLTVETGEISRKQTWKYKIRPPIIEGQIAKVPLPSGKFAIIDIEDIPKVQGYNWCVTGDGYAGRGATACGRLQTVRMHRIIVNAPAGADVDHINGNKLDNRQANLRVCSHKLNGLNRGLNKNNSSGHRGVSWNRAKSSWIARLTVDGKRLQIGRFQTKEAAIAAVNAATKVAHGEFARPSNGSTYERTN